jgi:hypothetical protein
MTKLDPNGQYMVEQMYVQYFLPKNRKGKYPLLMWHGGGLTGVTYESTPDGREGWLNMFIRKGWDVYISDAVERGRSGFRQPGRVADRADLPDLSGSVRALPHRRGRGSWNADPAKRKLLPAASFRRGLRQLHEAVGAALALDRQGDHRGLSRAGRQGLPVRAAAAQPGRHVRLQVAEQRPDKIKAIVAVESAPRQVANAPKLKRRPVLRSSATTSTSIPRWAGFKKADMAYGDADQGGGRQRRTGSTFRTSASRAIRTW